MGGERWKVGTLDIVFFWCETLVKTLYKLMFKTLSRLLKFPWGEKVFVCFKGLLKSPMQLGIVDQFQKGCFIDVK